MKSTPRGQPRQLNREADCSVHLPSTIVLQAANAHSQTPQRPGHPPGTPTGRGPGHGMQAPPGTPTGQGGAMRPPPGTPTGQGGAMPLPPPGTPTGQGGAMPLPPPPAGMDPSKVAMYQIAVQQLMMQQQVRVRSGCWGGVGGLLFHLPCPPSHPPTLLPTTPYRRRRRPPYTPTRRNSTSSISRRRRHQHSRRLQRNRSLLVWASTSRR